MSDLINRTDVERAIKEYFKSIIDNTDDDVDCVLDYNKNLCSKINEITIVFDMEYELRLLKNYLYHKPKIYGQTNPNYVVVRELLMNGTSHAGMTSCIVKCHELGIDPYGYELK